MKFEDIQPQATPEILDEVKMTTSVYDDFIDSGVADGLVAGFEAELIFRGGADGGGGIDYDADPDMDDSEDTRPDSIDEICDFFHDGDYNSSRHIRTLREELNEAYYEWRDEQLGERWSEVEESIVEEYISENDWDQDEVVENYLRDELELSEENIESAMEAGKVYRTAGSSREQSELKDGDMAVQWFAEANDHANDMLDEKVQESISDQDSNHDLAREKWEEHNSDDFDEDRWLRDVGYSSMIDVYHDRRDIISWPYWTYPETKSGYTEEAAQRLADSLENDLDVNVKVSGDYHSAKRRPGLWIFEPDSSLEPDNDDDLPVEIISPPMPLKQTLEILPLFFQWAEENDAYANESTGFHVGVSLPHTGGRIDYLKLALFLGDQYVLDKFDRGANYFTKSAFEKIKLSVISGKIKTQEVADTLKLLKHDLIELANKTLKTEPGHGKYTSINLKNDYVEFRSMGSERYVGNPEKVAQVVDTIKRYAYAMYIASRPDLFRDEYAKKLYKLLDTSPDSADAIKQFADYVTAIGGAHNQTVKNFMVSLQTGVYKDAPLPDRKTPARSGSKASGKYWWNVKYNNQRMEVVATNKMDARTAASKEWGLTPEQTKTITASDITPIKPFQDSPGGVGKYWSIISGGQEVFRITASTQGDANQMAREWLAGRSPEYRQAHAGEEVEVVPLQS